MYYLGSGIYRRYLGTIQRLTMEIFDSSLLRINLDLEDKKKAILLLADAIEQETLNCRAEVEKLEALCEAHMRTAGEKKQFELTKGLLKVDV